MLARLLYSLILFLIQPIVVLRLCYKSLKLASYRGRMWERYGFNAPKLDQPVWIHAVSVGEAITAKPLMEYYLDQGFDVLVTTTTPTGADQVKRMMGDRVTHRFLPQDIPWLTCRFIQCVKPRCLLIIETELWPNLIHQCQKLAVPTVLVNGRLSEKSFQGYQKVAALSGPMLRAIRHVCVQTEAEAARFSALGVPAANQSVVPSLKFDAKKPEESQAESVKWRSGFAWNEKFVWLAASTHGGEERQLISVQKALLESGVDSTLIIVPRHPDRFNDVHKLCAESGLVYTRFSESQADQGTQLYLADVMGKMWSFLQLADVCFIGNSLNNGGGHNVMEPALCAKPIISGPAMFNFSFVSDQLKGAGGLVVVENSDQILAVLTGFLAAENREQAGQAAFRCAQKYTGGFKKTVKIIDSFLHSDA